MTTQTILSCAQFTTSPDGVVSCTKEVWLETYVIPADQAAMLDLVLNGGFDVETFTLFCGATLTMFCIGFGVGLIISQVRKIKSI